MTQAEPTVRSLELGQALRDFRGLARLTLAQVAPRIDVSVSKLSRIENGFRHGTSSEEVAAMLALYGVTGSRRAELLDLARNSSRRGWWQPDTDRFLRSRSTFGWLEHQAEAITCVELTVVPGLLQTGEYCRALLTSYDLVDEAEIELRVAHRMRRQRILRRATGAPTLLALIDELALTRLVGGPGVLGRQLDHLVEWSCLPNVSIRVLPNVGAHAAIDGPFTVLRKAGRPAVVYIEASAARLLVENSGDLAKFELVVRNLLTHSLDEVESLELLAGLRARLTGAEAPSSRLSVAGGGATGVR